MKVVTNGISDGFFDSCLARSPNVFQPIFSSFRLLFTFDSLNWILVELLLLLPIFFRLYGFGIQQKLTKFYNTTRNYLIHIMYLFGISTVTCSGLQLLFESRPACVVWDGTNYQHFVDSYVAPSLDLVVITILMCILSTVLLGMWHNTKASMFEVVFYVIAVLFYVIVFSSTFLSGTITINQAIFSVALGVWLFFLFRILPPVFVPLFSILLICISLGFFISIIISQGRFADCVRLSVVPGIRGCLLLAVHMGLYLRYVSAQDNFTWFRASWMEETGANSDECIAVIPGIVNVANVDVFGKRLKKDIFDSAIAFIAVLVFNEFVVRYFNFALFSV